MERDEHTVDMVDMVEGGHKREVVGRSAVSVLL